MNAGTGPKESPDEGSYAFSTHTFPPAHLPYRQYPDLVIIARVPLRATLSIAISPITTRITTSMKKASSKISPTKKIP